MELEPLAVASGNRKVILVPLAKVAPLTGLRSRHHRTRLDDRALEHDFIVASAGQKGLRLRLSPQDYLSATKGKAARIAREATSDG